MPNETRIAWAGLYSGSSCARRGGVARKGKITPAERGVKGLPFQSIGGGFTLVELLVVIGIIALLIAILLPSLQMARRSAQRTACSAKLHSIMVAAQLHRNEHMDYYPLAGLVPGVTPETLEDPYARKYEYFSMSDGSEASRQLCPITTALETEMAGSRSLYSGGGIMNVSGEAGREAVMLNPQGLTKMFLCPAHVDAPIQVNPQFVFLYLSYGGGDSLMEPQSYIFNEFVLGWNDDYGHLRGKGSLIHQSALTMFAADGLGGNTLASHEGHPTGKKPLYTVYNQVKQGSVTLADAYTAPPFGNDPSIKAGDKLNFDLKRHSGKINVAYCDGHVESRNISAGDLANVWITPP